jgi:hypothetical protein
MDAIEAGSLGLSAGLSLLNGVNSFLVDNKLTKSALDIDLWKVPNP